ncbi:unnamed protein product [Nezara viridula]|uniref:Uncharacterized protein n=1 Tax=Nezara viridula TaxID=85310 RepID=A0A9P0EAU8_NEZVI|nr:unnamed protein product [Nezara viridula]
MQPQTKLNERKKIKLDNLSMRNVLELVQGHEMDAWGIWSHEKFNQRKCRICRQIVDRRYHFCPQKFWDVKEEWNIPPFETEREDPGYFPLINEFPKYYPSSYNRILKYHEKKSKIEYLMRILYGNDIIPYRIMNKYESPQKEHHPTPKVHTLPEKCSSIEIEEQKEELETKTPKEGTVQTIHITQFSLDLLKGKKVVFKRSWRYYHNWKWMISMAEDEEEEKLSENNDEDNPIKTATQPVDESNVDNLQTKNDKTSPEEVLTEDSVIPGIPSATIKAWRARLEYIRTRRHVGIQCPSNVDTIHKKRITDLDYEFEFKPRKLKKKRKSNKKKPYKPRIRRRLDKKVKRSYIKTYDMERYMLWKKKIAAEGNTCFDSLSTKSRSCNEKNMVYNRNKVKNVDGDFHKKSHNKSLEELLPVQILFAQTVDKKPKEVVLPSNVEDSSAVQLSHDHKKDIFPISSNNQFDKYPSSMHIQLIGRKPRKMILEPNVADSSRFQLGNDIGNGFYKISSKKQSLMSCHRSSNIKLVDNTTNQVVSEPNMEYTTNIQPIHIFENSFNVLRCLKNNMSSKKQVHSINDDTNEITISRYIEPENRFLKAETKKVKPCGDLVKHFPSSFLKGCEQDDCSDSVASSQKEKSFLSLMTHPRSDVAMDFSSVKDKYKHKCQSSSRTSGKPSGKTNANIAPASSNNKPEKRFKVCLSGIESSSSSEIVKKNKKVNSVSKRHKVFHISKDRQINSFTHTKITLKCNKWAIQNFPILKASKYEKYYRNKQSSEEVAKKLLPVSSPVFRESIEETTQETVTDTPTDIEYSISELVSTSTPLEYSEITSPLLRPIARDTGRRTIADRCMKLLKESKLLPPKYCRWKDWLGLSPQEIDFYSESSFLDELVEVISDIEKKSEKQRLSIHGQVRSTSPTMLAAIGEKELAIKYCVRIVFLYI